MPQDPSIGSSRATRHAVHVASNRIIYVHNCILIVTVRQQVHTWVRDELRPPSIPNARETRRPPAGTKLTSVNGLAFSRELLLSAIVPAQLSPVAIQTVA
jgi:hypothetical protein